MLRFSSRAAVLHEPVDVRTALGLKLSDDDLIGDDREAMLAAVAPLWPIATLALLLLPAGLGYASGSSGQPILTAAIAITGLLGVVFGGMMWGVLRVPTLRRLPTHLRISVAIACSGGIAIVLTLLAADAAQLADPAHRVAGVVAAIGVIIIVVTALGALRAATLAYAAGLVAAMLATRGFTPASASAIAIGALFAFGTLNVSRRHLATLAARRQARDAEQLARRLVTAYEAHGPGWFWQTDRSGRVTYLSAKVADEFAGFGVATEAAALTSLFRVDVEATGTARTLTFHLSSRTSFADYPVRPATPGSPERWWSISGRPLLDEIGRFQGFIGSGSDLTEKRRAQAEIARLALFDSLTGLANRQRMRFALEQSLSPQSGQGTTGLLLLDLDRFKAVNDTQGHQMGDELLKQVAQRLQRTVGETGLVGRLGGDEFQVIVPREGRPEVLSGLADAIIAELAQPFVIDRITLQIGCSVGIAVAPLHGDSPEVLIRNADLALYDAKGDGRGVHRFYRDQLLEGAKNRKRLEDDLRHALKSDQLFLTYQPVVATEDAHIVGYEALLRWDHPQRGLISPSEFIPVAEECGLIESIGEWVLRTAVAEAATWPRAARVAVNVSPIQFANAALPGIVTSALASSGLPPERLELEITEGVFLNEDSSSDKMFRTLKSLGVRLALDDFGTGYSSLGYLKKAPFDKIKIDQSFVRGAIQPGNRNAAIIKAIVNLAETLGMETTAEGVEQQDEIGLIRDLGCSHIQGFVYGRPARCADVAEQLQRYDGYAEPIGFRTSRPPRYKMLRKARLELGDEVGEVRIRDISPIGVMIDGVDLPVEAVNYPVRIEVIDGEMLTATIRWVDDGRAGLAFDQAFDLRLLNAANVRRAA
jgi:diguanylate cyclase (GGDEF)-like protein